MKIGIIGAGNLGIELIKILENHNLVIIEKSFNRIQYLADHNIFAVSHYNDIPTCDLVFIIVNTTSKEKYNYDNLIDVLNHLKNCLTIPLLIISSTCEPSFFNNGIYKDLEKRILYHPFFVRQGLLEQDIRNPEFVLIGDNFGLSSQLCKLYQSINVNRFLIMDILSASIVKLAINTYLTMKITYANLIGDLCKVLKVDPNIVLHAIGQDKRINPFYMKYGFGYGGPCLPIDTVALKQTLIEANLCTDLPKTIENLNAAHLKFQVEDAITQQSIFINGIGFKENSSIIIHSQKLLFAELVAKSGVPVKIRESSHVIDLLKGQYNDLFEYETC
jgi:nucleotide sugar dehydrogenase